MSYVVSSYCLETLYSKYLYCLTWWIDYFKSFCEILLFKQTFIFVIFFRFVCILFLVSTTTLTSSQTQGVKLRHDTFLFWKWYIINKIKLSHVKFGTLISVFVFLMTFIRLVCITEQHYVSGLYISGFSSVHAMPKQMGS